jgi:hypothetical protein
MPLMLPRMLLLLLLPLLIWQLRPLHRCTRLVLVLVY